MKIFGTVDKTKNIKRVVADAQKEVSKAQSAYDEQMKSMRKELEIHKKSLAKINKDHEIRKKAILEEQNALLNQRTEIEALNDTVAKEVENAYKALVSFSEKTETQSSLQADLQDEMNKSVRKLEKLLKTASDERERTLEMHDKTRNMLDAAKSIMETAKESQSQVLDSQEELQGVLEEMQEYQQQIHEEHVKSQSRVNAQMLWILEQREEIKKKEKKIKSDRLRLRDAYEKIYGKKR